MSRLTLMLPEPPSMNAMLGYAKAWKGRKYYVKQQEWRDEAEEHYLPEDLPMNGMPWERYALRGIHFKLWNRRDPLELLAGLKWALDLLVDKGWLVDDTENNLLEIEMPTQEIDRNNRGVTLTIERR